MPARLQLAALYAATSTLLPEPHTHRATGAQTALQLLRQCWGNRPLTIWELCQLQRVGQLGGHLAPALHLLAHELQLSVWQLHELGVAFAAAGASGAGGHASPASGSGPKGGLARPRLNADAAAAYLLEAGSNGRAAAASAASVCAWWQQPQPANPRQLLAPGERARVLGMGQDGPSAVAIGTWGQRRGGCVAPLLDIAEPLPVPLDVVSTTEEQLAALVVTVPVQGGSSGSGAGGSSTTAASGGALPPVAVPYPLQDDTAVPEALRGKAAFAAGPAAPLTPPAASPRSAPKARKASAAARGSTQAQPCGTASAARSGQRADGAAGLAAGAGAAAASGMPLPLAAAMHAELRASWEAHQGIVMAGRRQMAAGAKQRILALQVSFMATVPHCLCSTVSKNLTTSLILAACRLSYRPVPVHAASLSASTATVPRVHRERPKISTLHQTSRTSVGALTPLCAGHHQATPRDHGGLPAPPHNVCACLHGQRGGGVPPAPPVRPRALPRAPGLAALRLAAPAAAAAAQPVPVGSRPQGAAPRRADVAAAVCVRGQAGPLGGAGGGGRGLQAAADAGAYAHGHLVDI